MTKYACDLCKSDLASGQEPNRLQIGTKMHDLCDKCLESLEKVLAGTGTETPTLLAGPYIQAPFTMPMVAPSIGNPTITTTPNTGIGNAGVVWTTNAEGKPMLLGQATALSVSGLSDDNIPRGGGSDTSFPADGAFTTAGTFILAGLGISPGALTSNANASFCRPDPI